MGSRLAHDRSVVWGRTANYLPWQLSLLVENTEADEWVYAVVTSISATLSVPGRGWLRDALETAHPGHHWIGLLS